MAKTTETHHIAFVKSLVSNRQNRRGIALEIEDLARRVGEIETEFLVDLFHSEHDYDFLLKRLEKQNQDLQKWLRQKKDRFKFIIPNERYLYEKYKDQT